jgi:hypothetical protein
MKKNQSLRKNLFAQSLISMSILIYCNHSFAAIYKCNLPDGSVAYSNDKKSSRDCQVTNLNNSSNFSVIDTPSVDTLNKQANYYASTNTATNKNFPKIADGASSSNSNNIQSGNVTLTVSDSTQIKRDETRNSILQKELDAEQKNLDDNKLELTGLVQSLGKNLGNSKNDSLNEQTSDKIAKLQQSIEMHNNNIMALNKELKKPDLSVKDDRTSSQRATAEALKNPTITPNSNTAATTTTAPVGDNPDLNKIANLEQQIGDKQLNSKQLADAIAVKNSVTNSTNADNKNSPDVVNKIKEISKSITTDKKDKEPIKNFINK